MLLESFLSKLENVTERGGQYEARCPNHDDRKNSLCISLSDDGNILLKCQAGCETSDVVESMGLKMADLFSTNENGHSNGKPKKRIVATYDYCDETGKLLFQVVRYDPKEFKQQRPKPSGDWDWSVKGVRVVPYNLPALLAEPARIIFIVEGEKDVENLARIGVLATCNAGGAGKWTVEHAEFLRGRHVVILADNDNPGRDHAQKIALTNQGIMASTRIVELPGLPPKGDVSDWIQSGGTKKELMRIAEASPVWTPEVEPWPEPVSFDELNLPEFPTHALPEILQHFVEAESIATQTPKDLAALLALAVISATIARKVEVEPRVGWPEPVNLYVTISLPPGNRKSAVSSDTTKPLRDFESAQIESQKKTVAIAKAERRQAKKRMEKLELDYAKAGNRESLIEAKEIAVRLAEEAEPVLPRLLVDDVTPEKLEIILSEQGGRIASISAEGGVFDLMAGRYSKNAAPNFEVYLKGHAGDDMQIDRVGRESVKVKKPAITCAYTVQPQVIQGMLDNPTFRGRGLLARFLYAAPKSPVGYRLIAPPPVPARISEDYKNLVERLASNPPEGILGLSQNARNLFEKWEGEIETMLADGGTMEAMRDWGGKLAGGTLRIMAILHYSDPGSARCASEETVKSAIEIARYFIPHAEYVLNLMQANDSSKVEDATYILRWIKRHDRHEFTKRDAQQDGKRRFPRSDDINEPLAELVQRGFIRELPDESVGPGRPPSPSFEVNPLVFANTNPEKRSQYPHNSSKRPENSSSEDIEDTFEQSKKTNRSQVTI